MDKLCPRCLAVFPATCEYFYRYAPKRDHPHGGLQPYCKVCWKAINSANKAKLKAKKWILAEQRAS